MNFLSTVVYFIGDLGRFAAERKSELPARHVLKILENIGLNTANQQSEIASEIATDRALSSLRNIGIIFLEQKMDDATKEAVTCLGKIGDEKAVKPLFIALGKAEDFFIENAIHTY